VKVGPALRLVHRSVGEGGAGHRPSQYCHQPWHRGPLRSALQNRL